jgi:pilus assembly protein Flp/PilA
MFGWHEQKGEKGQGLVEYALIMVLVAIVVIVILATMGPAISGVYCTVIQELNPGSTCATAAAAAPEDQEDEEQQLPNADTASASYQCHSDETIQFLAYYGSDISPFYVSSVYQCAPGTNLHIDVPIEAGRHGDISTVRHTPLPSMEVADVGF